MQQVRDREGATPGTQPSALDDVLRELLEQAADIVEVDTAVVLLLGEEGRTLTATSDRSLEEQIAGALRIPVQRAQADGDASLLVSGITTADGLDPLLRANGIESLIAVPMLIDERIVGLLVAGTLAPRAFSTQETRLLQLFADRATLEVREGGELGLHRRAWTLQRSLLGEPFPEVPGLALAARYLPARASAGIGGGWYDVVVMRDGRAGLAIGHGARAAPAGPSGAPGAAATGPRSSRPSCGARCAPTPSTATVRPSSPAGCGTSSTGWRTARWRRSCTPSTTPRRGQRASTAPGTPRRWSSAPTGRWASRRSSPPRRSASAARRATRRPRRSSSRARRCSCTRRGWPSGPANASANAGPGSPARRDSPTTTPRRCARA